MNEDWQLREAKLEELRQQIARQKEEEQKAVEAELELNAIIRRLLEDKARERLSNIKLVNKELYLRVAQTIIYFAQAGQIRGKISEGQLLQIIEKVRGKREIKIKRK